MKILIAEDDPVMSKLLQTLLQQQGYEIVVTNNGKEAWEVLNKEDSPKIALLDWMMPQMDGIDTIRKLRENKEKSSIYVILLTAKSKIDDIVEGLEVGADDYITKPYNKKELMARLKVGERVIQLQNKLKEARDRFKHEAMHDHLTGILNRRAIWEEMKKEVARAHRLDENLSIGLFDIDHFKKINDKYGHAIGDEVLVNLVKIVKSNLRTYDHLGRYGGEEFIILIPGSNPKEANEMLERIRTVVQNNPIKTSIGEISLTISIGVTCLQKSASEMVSIADKAMYEAKDQGRNQMIYLCTKTAKTNSPNDS